MGGKWTIFSRSSILFISQGFKFSNLIFIYAYVSLSDKFLSYTNNNFFFINNFFVYYSYIQRALPVFFIYLFIVFEVMNMIKLVSFNYVDQSNEPTTTNQNSLIAMILSGLSNEYFMNEYLM